MSWEISSSGMLVAAVDVLASVEALLAALLCAKSFCCSRRVFASFCSMRRRSSSAGAIGVAVLLVDKQHNLNRIGKYYNGFFTYAKYYTSLWRKAGTRK